MPRAALLRQAVGVDPGEGADEGGLAVVDVAGRAEGGRAARHAGGDALDVLVAERAAVEHERPVLDARHHGRVGQAQRRGALLGRPRELDPERGKLRQWQRPAADPPDGGDHPAAEPGGQPLRASPDVAGRLVGRAQRRDRSERRRPGRGRARGWPRGRPATACRCAAPGPAGAAGRPRRRLPARRGARPAGRRGACRPRSTRRRRRPRPNRAPTARRRAARRRRARPSPGRRPRPGRARPPAHTARAAPPTG